MRIVVGFRPDGNLKYEIIEIIIMEGFSSQPLLIREKNSSICPDCGNIVSMKRRFKGNFLYITRKCRNGFNKRELVCKTDEISDRYFWNSPASSLIKEKDYLKNIRVFDILITKKCNSDCKVCFAKWCGDNYEEMNMKTLKGLLKDVKGARIVLNGGEPTERKDLVKLIKTVLESGNKPILYTNGLKLSNHGYLKRLKNAGLEEVSISFDGFDERIYESVRGGWQQYSKTIKAIKNLEKEKMKTSLYSTIIKGINENQVDHIIDYATLHSFVWTCSFKPLYLPGVNPSANFNESHVLAYSEILKLINEKIEEVDYQYIRLMQSVFYSLQKIFANSKNPVYLSWVDLPCVYMLRKGDTSRPLFSYNTLEKIQNVLETAPVKSSIASLSKIMPFNLDTLENSMRKRKVFRILLGGIMPQVSSYRPPIGMLCQKDNELKLYSYLAW